MVKYSCGCIGFAPGSDGKAIVVKYCDSMSGEMGFATRTMADRPYQSLDGGDEADMCLKIAHLVRDGYLMREVAQNIKLTLNL